ncbi:hypothetical protein HMPREF1544_05257 [Mucor circinelloides 1006PhL]|uniref:Uncharacterized protein n=1 Tax=Mucor circinelloides f. circinelloides (strain 1006PhL) TaxID=1220926 RepID=S2JCI4_MUCC1|nr:hypothetical protein HMPREF1544_05257 [Mucor circinelloides 1006PhL]
MDMLDRLKSLTLSYPKDEPPLKLALHFRETMQTMALIFLSATNGIDWTFIDR